ncbi:MAG: hypothetical protein FWD17_11255 [Polyangiaceae bacterium]|nr:hypothetical protein [Polyangiaceae bacterium]
MGRDSLFGERIVWQGRCQNLSMPFTLKVVAGAAAIVSAITLCYAVVVAKSLNVPVGGMVLFAGWSAAIALAAWRLPIWWRSQVEYVVTERRVSWQRGRLSRFIETRQISYALVRWTGRDPSVGDLVLVRAVPTGALRRTLSLTLHGVEAPDRLWAMIRGVEPGAPLGSGEIPLAQRLDPGERVLWSGAPVSAPWTTRRFATAVTAAGLVAALAHQVLRSVPALVAIVSALTPSSAAFLLVGASLTTLFLFAVATGVTYAAFVRPSRLTRQTRYFVTDARVLIRRGGEELSLDRSRIAYVIDAPSRKLHDVFLVLDGPYARAFAPSGAFGEEEHGVDGLRPVFAAIDDADTVGRILGERDIEKRAA